ncbi:MAG: trypsin-like peptidase domain-containing protein [bacterium]|nr:trypsin-like peptidase domain-containing protein [bacterium]
MSDESNSVSADRKLWADLGSETPVSAPDAVAASNPGAPSDPAALSELGAESAASMEDAASAAASLPACVDSQVDLKRVPASETSVHDVRPLHLATSTFFSLVMVLAILLLARWMVPPLVESVRYGWYRGQLRAEYEVSGQRLKSVSLDSLADVSRMVSQRLGPSVVHINVRRPADALAALHEGLLPDEMGFEGQGSGFVIREDGFILTNQHVLDGGTDIEVTLSDGRKLPAEVIGSDRHTDLAVLYVNAKTLMPVEWGDSEEIIVGTPVWAVGSPFGLQQTVTFGIISGKHRVDFRMTADGQDVRRKGGTPYGDLMQSDVALNPGNSGGPLVNTLGQVVGVNAAILGETFQGVSFSIPSKVAARVAELLINEGEVPRGWLGVGLDELTQDEKYLPDGSRRDGVRVRSFPPGMVSPGRRAGLQIGDVIVKFEGRPVTDSAGLIRMIGESPVGSEVVLHVQRPLPQAEEQPEDEVSNPQTNDAQPAAYRTLELRVKLARRDPTI